MAESAGERFQHLLEPIRNLAENWDIDIASDLEDYLHELEGLKISLKDGEPSVNFAEAALIIQGSACVYSKKVEYLYKLLYKTLSALIDRRRKRKARENSTDSTEDPEDVLCNDEPVLLSLDDHISTATREALQSTRLPGHGYERMRNASLLRKHPTTILRSVQRRAKHNAVSDTRGTHTPFLMLGGKVHASGALLLGAQQGTMLENAGSQGSMSQFGSPKAFLMSQQQGSSDMTMTPGLSPIGASPGMGGMSPARSMSPDMSSPMISSPQSEELWEMCDPTTYPEEQSTGTRKSMNVKSNKPLKPRHQPFRRGQTWRQPPPLQQLQWMPDIEEALNHQDQPKNMKSVRDFNGIVTAQDSWRLFHDPNFEARQLLGAAARKKRSMPAAARPNNKVLQAYQRDDTVHQATRSYQAQVRRQGLKSWQKRNPQALTASSNPAATALHNWMQQRLSTNSKQVGEASMQLSASLVGDKWAGLNRSAAAAPEPNEHYVMPDIDDGFDFDGTFGSPMDAGADYGTDLWSQKMAEDFIDVRGAADSQFVTPHYDNGEGLSQILTDTPFLNGEPGLTPNGFSRSRLSAVSYDELCRAHLRRYLREADKFVKETSLSSHVEEWRDRLEPMLESEKQRPAFDMQTCETEILEDLQRLVEEGDADDVKDDASLAEVREEFGEDIVDLSQSLHGREVYEVCRMFVATLQLANDRGVDIVPLTEAQMDATLAHEGHADTVESDDEDSFCLDRLFVKPLQSALPSVTTAVPSLPEVVVEEKSQDTRVVKKRRTGGPKKITQSDKENMKAKPTKGRKRGRPALQTISNLIKQQSEAAEGIEKAVSSSTVKKIKKATKANNGNDENKPRGTRRSSRRRSARV